MLTSPAYLILSCVALVVAAPENITRHQSDCSAWGKVAKDLRSTLVGGDGALTDNGRASVRVPFHDCFPGACDGSIILANECTDRPENGQMIPICGILGQKAKDFNVGTADIIQLAGALSIRAAGGPNIGFYAGRQDSSTANPAGQMPGQNDPADKIIGDFRAKGFSPNELVALLGAHTVAKNRAGQALDTTDARWDNVFYSETEDLRAPATLNSDKAVSRASDTRRTWSGFAGDSGAWESMFIPAMQKMTTMGNDAGSLTDCSRVISDAFQR
ncbi:class II peroxidase [Apiospora arundinis]|uniref:Peroxidase n=1 Tax=Apiospora arundinis TaxID=335852 RepID=A0ABR2JMU2_9PEZI